MKTKDTSQKLIINMFCRFSNQSKDRAQILVKLVMSKCIQIQKQRFQWNVGCSHLLDTAVLSYLKWNNNMSALFVFNLKVHSNRLNVFNIRNITCYISNYVYVENQDEM
jgi:hypothetical protein